MSLQGLVLDLFSFGFCLLGLVCMCCQLHTGVWWASCSASEFGCKLFGFGIHCFRTLWLLVIWITDGFGVVVWLFGVCWVIVWFAFGFGCGSGSVLDVVFDVFFSADVLVWYGRLVCCYRFVAVLWVVYFRLCVAVDSVGYCGLDCWLGLRCCGVSFVSAVVDVMGFWCLVCCGYLLCLGCLIRVLVGWFVLGLRLAVFVLIVLLLKLN